MVWRGVGAERLFSNAKDAKDAKRAKDSAGH